MNFASSHRRLYREAVTSAAALDAAAALAPSHPATAIDSLPWLARALAADAEASAFEAWGSSTVVDENVGAPVIPRPLFDELHRRAHLAAEWPVGNAGVLHVYGYLLSDTPTPYGLKRERWLTDDLARACGLPAGALLPWTGTRTLLQRVTAAASAVLGHPDALVEHVGARHARIALTSATAGSAALAYAVDDLLVTMFPVADATAVRAGLGAPRLRWNAA